MVLQASADVQTGWWRQQRLAGKTDLIDPPDIRTNIDSLGYKAQRRIGDTDRADVLRTDLFNRFSLSFSVF
jgi:hypothetical protein